MPRPFRILSSLALVSTAGAALPADPPPDLPLVQPLVQPLVPGVVVRELPVALTNLNNVEYAPDGRLFAAGYDGRLHVLRDADGDGLEEAVTTFHDRKSNDYPLGLAVRGDDVFVVRRRRIDRHTDTDRDGTPDRAGVAAEWPDADVRPEFRDARRVSGGLGLAVGPDGSFYVGVGSLNTFKPYMLLGPDGKEPKPYSTTLPGSKSTYDLAQPHGVVLRISPDGKTREVVATGVRYPVSLQLNRHGNLFATDQEGATWLPNGNPFDELLQITKGRHYGFPPRHPAHLPGVVDEPSVFDYAPQHQSACGFRFNEPAGPGGKTFGPPGWAGDAFVTGESRGKLFRTKLVRTPAGYVAANQLLSSLTVLPVDVAVSPAGDLVVCCHSGGPDWGSGPAGAGRVFKLTLADPAAPQPVAAWAASPTEARVAFDRPLDPATWAGLRAGGRVEGGRYVAAGDRFERVRPGYAVVRDQLKAPRAGLAVVSAALTSDARTVVLRTPPRPEAVGYSVTLPFPARPADPTRRSLPRAAGVDLGFDLTGVEAAWRSADGTRRWDGWLPHPDWQVSTALTAGSSDHDRLRELARAAGTLELRGQLDLGSMLHPAVQPGGDPGFRYPPETVTVTFSGGRGQRLTSTDPGAVVEDSGATARLRVADAAPGRWVPFTLTTETGGAEPALTVHWTSAPDDRPRPLPVRRVLLPWATPAGRPAAVVAPPPEVAGGDRGAGRALFFGKAGCHKCHAVRGEGGSVGPDLTNVVHRDYGSVLADIREPSAAVNPDFLAYRVEVDDGRTLTGVTTGSDAEVVRVADAAGAVTAVRRRSVTGLTPLKASGMPEKLLDALSAKEVKDLMTFLLTDGRGAPAATR